MKKLICLILVLTFCFGLACPVFASEANDDFLSSPGTEPECDHEREDLETKIVGAKDPTCTEDGYTGDVVCADCGKVIKAGTVIPRTGHTYDENGICTECGADKNNPQTGDNSMASVWMIVMAVAVTGLVAVTIVYRKKFANQ